MRATVVLALAVFVGAIYGCSSSSNGGQQAADSGPQGCTPGGDQGYLTKPFDDLSQYCMVDLTNGDVVPKDGVVPYDLNTPLFSDYAIKRRTVWIPAGQSATYSATEAFDFPVGTVFTKSFGFPDDARKAAPKITWIETRVLYHAADGWKTYSYTWDAGQTKASLNLAGGVQSISFIHTTGETLTASYLVPSANQCKQCHSFNGAPIPIGPKAGNLHRDFAYATGTEDQLAHWQKLGMVTLPADPTQIPKLPVWDDDTTGTVEERTRAWLDVNCAHCHRAEGGASTTGLFLRWTETDPTKLGTCKPPVAAGKATGGFQYDVVPGDPDHSILVYRISSTEPSVAMPAIGRSLVQTESLALVKQWIQGQTGSCTATP